MSCPQVASAASAFRAKVAPGSLADHTITPSK